jgi:hypothetical protein
MKLLLIAAALAATVLAFGASPAGSAPRECQGFMVCVPVRGPWVVVPTGNSVPRPHVEYQLSCPRNYIVGGLDAELSTRGIDVSFIGKLGSPVNPGITTSRAAVFTAMYVGATARAPSFRPHIGCIPGSGGGRVPTAYKVVRPGNPTVRRVATVRVRPGSVQRVTKSCTRRERLVDGSHALAFRTQRPPSAALVSGVRLTQSFGRAGVNVAVRSDETLAGVRAFVQVHAICSRVS